MTTVFQSTKCSGCDEPLPEGLLSSVQNAVTIKAK